MKNVDDNIDELVEMSKGRSELNNKLHREEVREEEVKDMMPPLFGTSSAEEWSRMAGETILSEILDE